MSIFTFFFFSFSLLIIKSGKFCTPQSHRYPRYRPQSEQPIPKCKRQCGDCVISWPVSFGLNSISRMHVVCNFIRGDIIHQSCTEFGASGASYCFTQPFFRTYCVIGGLSVVGLSVVHLDKFYGTAYGYLLFLNVPDLNIPNACLNFCSFLTMMRRSRIPRAHQFPIFFLC